MKGLEPPRREAPDPKSGMATNYITSANELLSFFCECKYKYFFPFNPTKFNIFYFFQNFKSPASLSLLNFLLLHLYIINYGITRNSKKIR